MKKRPEDKTGGLWFLAGVTASMLLIGMTQPRRVTDKNGFSRFYDFDDLTRSDKATELGIDAQWDPPEWVYANAALFARDVLDPITEYLLSKYPNGEVKITSWWRAEETNQQVGGVSNSLHLEGLAVDMEFYLNGVETNRLIVEAFLAVVPEWNEIIVYGRSDMPSNIHITLDPGNNIGEVWHRPPGAGYEPHNIWWLQNSVVNP